MNVAGQSLFPAVSYSDIQYKEVHQQLPLIPLSSATAN